MEKTLSTLTKGRLREQTHPFIDPGAGGTGTGTGGAVAQALKEKPQDVIVFVVGGVTYEEGKLVAGVNESLPGVRIVLGGTSVVNSAMFLKVLPLLCLKDTLLEKTLPWVGNFVVQGEIIVNGRILRVLVPSGLPQKVKRRHKD